MYERQVDPAAARRERAVERLGLAARPRKPVEDGAARRVGGRQALEEDVDDRLVGHELPAAHVPVGRPTQRRSGRDRGAQQVARREDRHAQALGQDRRLGPLPGARGAEKDDDGHLEPGRAAHGESSRRRRRGRARAHLEVRERAPGGGNARMGRQVRRHVTGTVTG